MRPLLIALTVACVSVLIPCGVARGEEGDADIPQLLHDLLSGGSSAEEASAELQRLGVGVIPAVLLEVPEDVADPTPLVDALERMGTESALASILTHRSAWWWVNRRDVWRIVEALRSRRDRTVFSNVELRRAALENPRHLSPDLPLPVGEALPQALTDVVVPVRRDRKGNLELDLEGEGRFRRIRVGRPEVVSLGSPDAERALVVYSRMGEWYAAPASVWRGAYGGTPVEILDADMSASVTEDRDRIRWGKAGAFQPLGASGLGMHDGAIVRYEVETGGASPTLRIATEPMPDDLPADVKAATQVLNRWRNANGLPPQYPDVPRSRAAALHVAYWRLHGYTGHGEDPTKSGYTEQGAEAGANSSCWPGQSGLAEFGWRHGLWRCTGYLRDIGRGGWRPSRRSWSNARCNS